MASKRDPKSRTWETSALPGFPIDETASGPVDKL